MIANQIAGLLTGGVTAALTDYESIATFNLASATASVSFTSIPSTYTHLQIRAMSRTSNAGEINLQVRVNNDTGNNYAQHFLQGDGASTFSGASSTPTNAFSTIRVPSSSNAAGVFGVGIFDLLDYANVNKNKTSRVLTGFDANGSGFVLFNSGLYMNTTAINRVDIFNNTGSNLAANSSFALYGIK